MESGVESGQRSCRNFLTLVMDEQKDQNSRDSTEGESVSLSPNLPSPPILPHQAAQQVHRTTNFFIDNILRPDFGCKKELGNRERAQTSGRENVNPLVIRPSHASSLCQDSNCSSDSTSSSSSSSSSSPTSKQTSSSKSVEANGTITQRFGENPVMAVNASNGGSATAKDNQPMLWPAWVYCTRYSDRPSSGKALSYWSCNAGSFEPHNLQQANRKACAEYPTQFVLSNKHLR